MEFKAEAMSFRLKVVIRIFLAIGFGISAYYFAFETPFWLVSGWMLLFFVLTVISLIRLVEKSDRELSNFLMAIRQNDFTNTYPQSNRKTKQLYRAFNVITSEFIRMRSEKESNFHFLKTVVEHSGVPLIAYTVQDERVNLVNKAAKELFGIPHFSLLSSLTRVSTELVETVKSLHTDDKVLLKLPIRDEVIYLSVVVRELVLQEKRNKVIAFHNINSELDQKEVESWQKLIRVMTHEIKNSVIPIATLAEVVNEMFRDKQAGKSLGDFNEEDIEDLVMSIKTIEKRSKGLVKFVTNYGDLAKVPHPQFQEVDLCELLKHIEALQLKTLKKDEITFRLYTPKKPILIRADPEMIEQVLINLIKNAREALISSKVAHPVITIELAENASGVILTVQDNASGMDGETLENIFVPFFTTKKEGSGIGLSYSKQIMRAHNGNIRVRSSSDQGTTFELRF